MKKALIAAIAVIAAVAVFFIVSQVKSNTTTEGIASVNGRIELKRLDIATLYSGRVEELLVQEGDNVAQDDILARLSSAQSQSQYDAALAQIEVAKANQKQAVEAVNKASKQIAVQEQQLKVAKIDYNNAKKLRSDNLISKSELDTRLANFKSAQANLESKKVEKQEAQARVAQAKASLEQAYAQANAAKSQNDDMVIRSPIAGRVEYKLSEVGTVIGVGAKVVSILDLSDIYLNVFLPSYQSNQLRIGDEARIKIDGTDYVFPAKITYVAADAQFTPKSVETTEERAKLVFKVKLQIPHDIAKTHSALLKSGMPAMGYVKYDSCASWPSSLEIKLPKDK